MAGDEDKKPNVNRGRALETSASPEVGSPENDQAKDGQTRDQQKIGIFKTKPETLNCKEGTSGTKVALCANFFKVTKKPTFAFTLYRVDFEPDIEHAGMRKAFVASQRETFGGYLFDGQNMIYLTQRLAEEVTVFKVMSREEKEYKMTVKNTGTNIEPTDSTASQVLNVLLRRTMEGLKLQLVGRNFYDPENKVTLGEFKLELWPGYITSIRQHEMDVLVCCEVSHKVMRQETIYEILRSCRVGDDRNWQDNFRKEIIGSIVLTDYNNHTYRVDDVQFSASPSSTFDQRGKQVSYMDYYKTKYNLDVRDPRQPMLVSNPKAADVRAGRSQAIFLIPELCRATGLTDKMRANFQMMRAMADHTQMDPVRRSTRLLDFSRRLHNTPASVNQMKSFNTDIGKQLVTFTGRALKQEKMLFGNGASFQNDDRVDWTNALKGNAMYKAIPLTRWAILYPKRAARDAQEFLKILTEVARGMDYEMSPPKEFELPDDRTATYVATLQEVLPKDPKMIMVVVPNNAGDRYAAIKKLTCVNRAVPTQVIVQKTMMPKKGNMSGVKSIATKVMIQINCKLGGAPWMINFPLKGTMSIGFDVNHDTNDRSKSYGAFIASMDLKESVSYYSGVSPHRDGAELSTNIELHMVQALKQFKKLHQALPEHIFFYRDGVGDGQIEYVHSQEVRRLEAKLEALYNRFGEGKLPKFSFIIVNKRINTRIFALQGNRCANPVSGTVVDNTITLPERYDFFLVSQSVRQGTVAPSSYNVIHDTNGFTADKMQMLTYKQTHLYYNWSGCTRVPAVVQYAHKLALLVGQSLHQPPNEALNQQLYFL